MPDTHTPEQRSYNMSRIRGSGTNPEERVRKYLFSKGFRYRKNDRKLPGKPDIVLPKYKTVIFVHGCFWHMHCCDKFHWPKTNQQFWENKIKQNAARDETVCERLKSMGWSVLVVWECQLSKSLFEQTMDQLEHDILRRTM